MRVFIGVIVGIAIATALVVWGVDRAFAEDYGTPIGVGTVLLGHANVTLTGAATAVQICPQNTSHRIGVYVNNTGSNAIQNCGIGGQFGETCLAQGVGTGGCDGESAVYDGTSLNASDTTIYKYMETITKLH